MIKQQPTIIGWMENVGFPALGIKGIEAKIDTGAYSGALHATDIRVVRRGVLRRRVLKFIPLGNPMLVTEATDFDSTYIRSATGHRMRRHVIATQVTIGGTIYPIRIGLSDRSDMKRPVLIGRRFLRENNLMVDVRINQDLDDEGENTR